MVREGTAAWRLVGSPCLPWTLLRAALAEPWASAQSSASPLELPSVRAQLSKAEEVKRPLGTKASACKQPWRWEFNNGIWRKQEQKQTHGDREHVESCQMGGGWKEGRKGEGVKKYRLVVTEESRGR